KARLQAFIDSAHYSPFIHQHEHGAVYKKIVGILALRLSLLQGRKQQALDRDLLDLRYCPREKMPPRGIGSKFLAVSLQHSRSVVLGVSRERNERKRVTRRKCVLQFGHFLRHPRTRS